MNTDGNRSALGREGEAIAAQFLIDNGYRVLGRNVRFRVGEMDIVAEEGGCLVFVEVKTRRSQQFGSAAEAVGHRKQQQLIRLAELYISGLSGAVRPCRFDVVTVEPAPGGTWTCRVIKSAFSGW